MKDKNKEFEAFVREEVQQFSSRPSDNLWDSISQQMAPDYADAAGGEFAPVDGSAIPDAGLLNWIFQNINLNLVGMITLGSLTLTVGTLLFINGTGKASLAEANSTDASQTEIEELAVLPPSALNDPMPDPLPSQNKTIYFPFDSTELPQLPEEDLENTLLPDENPEFLFDFEAEEDNPKEQREAQNDSGENLPIPCSGDVNIGDRIGQFKTELVQLLREDRLITSNDYKIRLFMEETGFSIENEKIESDVSYKYTQLLSKYNIVPCENRIAQITPKYVAIGDLREEGFRGQLRGDIDLQDLGLQDESLRINGEGTVNGNQQAGKKGALILYKEEKRSDFDDMKKELERQGLKVTSSSFNEDDGLITMVKLHFQHPRGLDFSLRGRNFDVLELKILKGDNGQLNGFSYRFNKEKVKNILLTTTGSISRTF